jgi:hypothetical protein
MNNDPKTGLKCSEFEALLAEALDGTLAVDVQGSFEAHGESCGTCGPLWSEAREGMLLLRGLEELEPPKNLVHNILAVTTMKDVALKSAEEPVITTWQERLSRRLQVSLQGTMKSRFVTSFAMAFFSLSLTLTLAGVKISDVKNVDLHPSALRKNVVLGFTQVEAKVTSYYENLRLVYVVQAKVRELRKNAAPASGTNNDNKQQNRNAAPDDGGRPQPQENYSRELDGSLIAKSVSRPAGAQI